MRKINLILLPSLLVLASCGVKSVSTTEESTIPEENTTTVESTTEVITTEESKLSYRKLSDSVNEYYKNVNTALRGDSFIDNLTPVISKDYVRYSYKEIWNILAEADEDPYNASNVVCMYTGKSIAKNLDSNSKGWNREHTWAKSHGFNQEGMDAYTDCHHLTATDSSINSNRGDLDFGEVSDYEGEIKSDDYGNQWIADTIFEPRDEVKGDVARMLFYMVVRYNDTSVLDLKLVNGTTSGSDAGYGELGDLATLLKWNYEDPVSDTEILRNEVVYKYQKNRNPFIDHPEWVNYMFPDTEYVDYDVDEDKVLSVIDEINTLPELVTLDDEEKVNACLEKMASLNPQEKLYVNNYEILTAAKYQIDYLESQRGLDAADINIDFSSLASADSGGYVAQADIDPDGYIFTATAYYTGSGEFRLGTNGKKISAVSLSEYGLSTNGAYLLSSFTTENMVKITVKLSSTQSGISAYHIYGKNDEGIQEFTVTKKQIGTENYLVCESEAYTGQFAIVIEGDTARCGIASIGIYTE